MGGELELGEATRLLFLLGPWMESNNFASRPRRRGGLLGTETNGKGGQKSETSQQAPTRKTKAAVDRRQNNKMLRQRPSGIAQQLPYHAIAVPTAVQSRVTKTMSVAPPLGNSGSERSPALKPSSTSLLLISSGLSWGSSTSSLLLISLDPQKRLTSSWESSSPPSSWFKQNFLFQTN